MLGKLCRLEKHCGLFCPLSFGMTPRLHLLGANPTRKAKGLGEVYIKPVLGRFAMTRSIALEADVALRHHTGGKNAQILADVVRSTGNLAIRREANNGYDLAEPPKTSSMRSRSWRS
jgi:hypothetical protein